MIKYKGYLIEGYTFSIEKTYYDGHRNEGTGVYDTQHKYRIINPRNGSQISHLSSESDAKTIVDQYTSTEGKQQTKDLLKKLSILEKELVKAEKEKEQLYIKMHKLGKSINKIKLSLPEKFL